MNLEGWVIAQCQGLTIVGKVRLPAGTPPNVSVTDATDASRSGQVALSPVYELKTQLAQQGSTVGTVRMAFPLWLYAIQSIELPPGCLVFPCEDLGAAEKADLVSVIQRGEDLMGQVRATASGVTLARTMPKVHGPKVHG